MGKLVAAFVFFLAASALAIHETKPPPHADAVEDVTPPAAHVDEPPTVRAVHDDVPPWVKYATPTPPPFNGPAAPRTRVITIEPSTIEIFNGESGGDIPDIVDRCPDQPNDSDDNDGCPEPDRSRVILID